MRSKTLAMHARSALSCHPLPLQPSEHKCLNREPASGFLWRFLISVSFSPFLPSPATPVPSTSSPYPFSCSLVRSPPPFPCPFPYLCTMSALLCAFCLVFLFCIVTFVISYLVFFYLPCPSIPNQHLCILLPLLHSVMLPLSHSCICSIAAFLRSFILPGFQSFLNLNFHLICERSHSTCSASDRSGRDAERRQWVTLCFIHGKCWCGREHKWCQLCDAVPRDNGQLLTPKRWLPTKAWILHSQSRIPRACPMHVLVTVVLLFRDRHTTWAFSE